MPLDLDSLLFLRQQLQTLQRATLKAPGTPVASEAAAALAGLLGACLEADARVKAHPQAHPLWVPKSAD